MIILRQKIYADQNVPPILGTGSNSYLGKSSILNQGPNATIHKVGGASMGVANLPGQKAGGIAGMKIVNNKYSRKQ